MTCYNLVASVDNDTSIAYQSMPLEGGTAQGSVGGSKSKFPQAL